MSKVRRQDESGAALLFVLVIISTVALVGSALLSFSFASFNTTTAIRDQGAASYAADGAAKVALSQLQAGNFPNDCATLAGDGLALGSGTSAFYEAAQPASDAVNAYVLCTPDSTTGSGDLLVGAANKPSNALFTVGNDPGLRGQDYSPGASNRVISVSGGNVLSNSTIFTGSNTLAVAGTGVEVKAALAAGCSGAFVPTACQSNAGAVATPTYPAPTDPVSPAPAPICTTSGITYAAFRPGLYKDLTYLNGTCGSASVVWFSPGTYYFDFTGTWQAPAKLIGGTPTDAANVPITGLDPANVTTLDRLSQVNPGTSGTCASPTQQIAPGVQFVFGGSSKVALGTGVFEICATYQADKVPMALYGPTAAIPVNGGTATSPVSAQTICTTTSCSMFTTPGSGQTEFHVHGFTYAPNARLVLTLRNSSGQVFNWGLVLRSLSVSINGASPTSPVVQLPPDSQGTATSYSTMHLSVWTCAVSSSPCDHSASSPARLRAKVELVGTTLKVLSWSAQR